MQGKQRLFKPCQNDHDSVKEAGEKFEGHEKLIQKFQRKSSAITHLLFLPSNPTILKAFRKTIPTQMKPYKCPEKKDKKIKDISKIQVVVYYQCCILIGWATTRLYVIAH